MNRSEEAYYKVEELRKLHPDKPNSELIKLAGFAMTQYYKGKKLMLGSTYKKAPKAVKPASIKVPIVNAPAPSRAPEPRLVFMMGTPDQIRNVLAGGVL